MNQPLPARDDAREFPIVDRCCYLNHAAISPWPRAVADAVAGFVEDNRRNGPLDYGQWLTVEHQARERAGRLLGGDSREVSFLKNTSDGLNLVAAGLGWQAGDEVVLPAGEFPSNRLPWLALADQGVRVIEVAIDGTAPEAALLEALSPRTRLMSVSSVGYATGLRLDLETLGKACRSNATLLCVDAIQHLGCLDLDVGRLPVDFVVAGCHKWLLSPEGLALFWSSPQARGQLGSFPRGWRARANPFTFSRQDGSPADDGRRFEPGTLNTMGLHAFNAAAGLLLDAGMMAVEAAVDSRVARLRRGLEGIAGIQVSTPPPERASGIVCFRAPGQDPDRLHASLGKREVITARRGDAIRLSPHFYTPDAQIDQALEAIESLAG